MLRSNALELCALNEAAYLLANTGHCQLPDGFSPPFAIRMIQGMRPRLLSSDPLDIWGYVARRADTAYIVFRGTQITSGIEFLQEWAEDALCLPLDPFPGKGNVHLGFSAAYTSLIRPGHAALQSVGEVSKVVITGHSLGAALATLCWADIGGELVTFAGPRVGDAEFASALWCGNTTRIVNREDVVPRIPTDPPFRHGGAEVVVDGPGSLLELGLAHSLTSYSAGLKKLSA